MARKNTDNYINSTQGRSLVLGIVIAIIGVVLAGRIFYLQILHGEEALNDFTLKICKERSIPSTRGIIYDRNGKVLAYNELAYNVTIEDVYEPYLMQIGFLSRTPRGRCATALAYEHLGITPPAAENSAPEQMKLEV